MAVPEYRIGGVRTRRGKIRYYVKKNGVKIARGIRSKSAARRFAIRHFNRTFRGSRRILRTKARGNKRRVSKAMRRHLKRLARMNRKR